MLNECPAHPSMYWYAVSMWVSGQINIVVPGVDSALVYWCSMTSAAVDDASMSASDVHDSRVNIAPR